MSLSWRSLKLIIPALIVGVCLTLAIPVPGGTAPRLLTPLSVASAFRITSAPVFIAIEEGYFAEQGIEVRLQQFRDLALVWPALINGQLDAVASTYSAGFIQAILQGAKMRIVADGGHTGPGDTSVAFMIRQDLIDSGRYRTPKDLRGMRINVAARATLSEMLVLQFLRNRAFLTERDVHLEQILLPQLLVDALRAKALDATTATEPLVTRLESLGLAKTVAVLHDVLPRAQYGVLIYGPNLVVRNPGLAQRFMNAYLRGVQQYLVGKTDRNIAIVQKYTRDDEALLRRMPWPLMHADGHVNVENIMQTQSWWVREGWLERTVTPDQFLDAAYARRAFQTLTVVR